MQKYVLGFAFDTNLRVALIRKDRPAFQAGKWNGIGGKVETDEEPIDAMVREFLEEAGVATSPSVWQRFAILRDREYEIHCFVTVWQPEHLDYVRTAEAEEVRVFTPQELADPDIELMPNLRWLMPMSLTLSENEIPVLINLAYRESTERYGLED